MARRRRLRKRLTQPIPDRLAPTHMWIGQRRSFNEKQLDELEAFAFDKIMEVSWLVVFSGPGYKDFEHAVTKESAQFSERFFQLRYPNMQSVWLQSAGKASTSRRKFDKSKWLAGAKSRSPSKVQNALLRNKSK